MLVINARDAVAASFAWWLNHYSEEAVKSILRPVGCTTNDDAETFDRPPNLPGAS